LESFIRFHDNNPKIGMRVEQGSDYVAYDKIKKRADTLIDYILKDTKFADLESQRLMQDLKEAYFTTSEGRNVAETVARGRRTIDCSSFLSEHDCNLAEAAYLGIPSAIIRYPKEDYEVLANWYCKVSGLPKITWANRFRKIPGHSAVNIEGVRHVWKERKGKRVVMVFNHIVPLSKESSTIMKHI
jgi:hypothetical protein